MRALITAGGHGTRLRPITHTTNKHLIPIANKPMIFYVLEKVAECGIKKVGIVIREGETKLQPIIGNGEKWGVEITYIEQVGGPQGLAHVLKVAKPFLAGQPFVYYLGDNIILGSIKKFIQRFKKGDLDALLALSEVGDPQRFGVPVIKNGRIIKVEEKPANPKSNYAVTGIYLYKPIVFDSVETIKKGKRGEFEISDVHTDMIKKGRKVGYEIITGWWKDTGKAEDLLEGNSLILQDIEAKNEGKIMGNDVKIEGKVSIGKGTRISGLSLIRGPVIIGENSFLEDVHIGPYTAVGDNVQINGAEVEHSIIFNNAIVRGGKRIRIVDSLVGNNSIITPKEETLPSGHKLLVGENALVEL